MSENRFYDTVQFAESLKKSCHFLGRYQFENS